jgi:glutaredoxin 3
MNKQVTIYTTPTCGYCKAAKAWFADNEVEYSEIDVSSDQDKAKEMIERSGQMGVPVIAIGEGEEAELIIGFDEPKIAAALGKA